MNKFEIAKMYQELPPSDFLRALLTIPEIRELKGVVAYIKYILKNIREYASYRIISALKGLNPFHKSSDQDVTPDYYDYTKSVDFEKDMQGLWKALDMSEMYLSDTYQELYEIMADFLGQDKEILATLELTREGYFRYTLDQGEKTAAVLSEEQFENMADYARNDSFLKALDFKAAELGVVAGKYHIVDVSNEIVSRFLTKSFFEQSKPAEKENIEEKEESESAKDSAPEKNEAAKQEPVKQFEKPRWQTLNPENDAVLKSNLYKLDPMEYPAYTVSFTLMPSLVKKVDGKEYYAVRLPGKIRGKEGNYKNVAQSAGINQIVLIPESQMQKVTSKKGNDYYRCTINLADKFLLCDKENEIVYADDDKTKPFSLSGLVVADKFELKKMLYDPSKIADNDKMVIDGTEVSLYSDKKGFRFAYSEEEKRAILIEYAGNEKEIVVPDAVTVGESTYPVTEIKDNAFANSAITSVNLPAGIAEIRNAAFQDCSRLQSITLPEHLKTLGDRVFFGCGNLEEIRIPGEVEEIGKDVFAGCLLKKIACDPGKKVRVEQGMLICNGVLVKAERDILSADGVVTVPDDVREIGGYACENLAADTLAFAGPVKIIGHNAFRESDIKSITGTANLKEVGAHAFYLSKIENIDLGSVKNIEKEAFASSELKEVRLEKIESIGQYAFSGTAKLGTVTLNASTLNPEKYADNAFLQSDAKIEWKNTTPEQERVLQSRKEKFMGAELAESIPESFELPRERCLGEKTVMQKSPLFQKPKRKISQDIDL